MASARAFLSFLFLSMAAASGCGSNESTEPPHLPGGFADLGFAIINDGGEQQMPTPVLDPVPLTVCTDSLALQGTTLASASVMVFGGASNVSTSAHPVTGRFCVDVPLLKSTTNSLQIQAQDPVLSLSDPVLRDVTHGDYKDDVRPPNIAFPPCSRLRPFAAVSL